MSRPAWFTALPAALVFAAICGCAGPRPDASPTGDATLARLNRNARAAYERDALPLAASLYEQALTRARALDDAAAIGDAAYNLAVCRIPLGDDQAAGRLLMEAESELARAGKNLADVLLIRAKLAHREGRREEALRFVAEVLAHPDSSPAPAHRLEAALLQGDIACDDGDLAGARAALDQAAREDPGPHARPLAAGLERLRGRILRLDHQPAAAARAFDREADVRRRARQPEAVVSALVRAGEAWREAGQPGTAAERYFRAARSAHAQGHAEDALRSVDLAERLATEAGETQLHTRALRLRSDIMTSLALPSP